VEEKVLFCREISKLYEEFIRINIDDLEIFNKELKGELTIVISEKKIEKNNSQELSESDKNIIKKMINKLTIKEITEIISQNKDISKKEIYNYCLKIKNEI
jgi:16S rRNA (cytidine1402-2'-O)-methyltransferase